MRKNLYKIFINIILLTLTQVGYSQLSDLHYLPPLKQATNNQAIEQQTIYLSTPETSSFDVKIYKGTSTTALTTLSLSKATSVNYTVADGDNDITLITEANTGIILNDSGLRFESTGGEKFYVNYRGRSTNQAASITSKGRAALGQKFKWGGAPVEGNTKSTAISATLGIMATEDNTSITISGYDTDCEFRLQGVADGITDNTINITLNKGQSYVLEAVKDLNTANIDGWIGASIVSDKDIAINNGMLNFGVDSSRASKDAGADQPVPEDKLGKEYIFVRGNGTEEDKSEFVIIIGTQENTEIYVNNETLPFDTIGVGEYVKVPSSKYSGTTVGKNMYITTTKDVYAYQVLAGAITSSHKTVSLNFVAPVNCLLPDTMDYISTIENIAGLTVSGGLSIIASTTTPNSAIEVYNGIGGATQITLPQEETVSGSSEWKTFYITGLTGDVSVKSTGPIAVGFIGFDGNLGIAGYFSGFDTVPVTELAITGGGCLPGGTVEVVTKNFESYQWYDNGVLVIGATDPTYTPTTSGDYYVRVTKGGCTYDSQPISAYYCTPDIVVTKTADKTEILEEETITFKITVENKSVNAVTNVNISDAIPNGLTITSASTSIGSWTSPNWTVGDLISGQVETITIVAKADAMTGINATSAKVNTATNTQDQVDGNTTTDSPSVAFTILNDYDEDGIADIYDIDDDNDGVLDTDECFFEPKSTTPTTGTVTELPTSGSVTINSGEVYVVSSDNNQSTPAVTVTINSGGELHVEPNVELKTTNLTVNGKLFMSDLARLETTGSMIIGQDAAYGSAISEVHMGVGAYFIVDGALSVTQGNVHGTNTSTVDIYMNDASVIETCGTLTVYEQNAFHKIGDSSNGNAYLITRAQVSAGGLFSLTNTTGGGINWIALSTTGSASDSTKLYPGTANFCGDNATKSSCSYWPSYLDADFSCGEAIQITTQSGYCNDTDNDGIPNHLDLDSDGDGCPDTIEANVPTLLMEGAVSNTDGTTTTSSNIDNAVIDITQDPVGVNGLAASLEDVDTDAAVINYSSMYSTYALDAALKACGTPMITQIYTTDTEHWVELTNIDPTNIVGINAATLALFKDGSDPTTATSPVIFANTTAIQPGASVLITNNLSNASLSNANVTPITNTDAIDFENADDVLVLTKGTESNAWNGRVDVVSAIADNTSYVRIDEISAPNRTYKENEWVAFIDDTIITYSDVANDNAIERHAHAPLLSEITNADDAANIRPGLHNFGRTDRNNSSWSNGYPDRSRRVRILRDFSTSDKLSARKLEVRNSRTLSITDNLLVVTDEVKITDATDEIRLISSDDTNKAQLIQTHTTTSKVTGDGKLLVDQNSTVPSKYRYNYLSSPVNTIGAENFTIASVLKDGTKPLDATSTIGNGSNNIAKEITFVSGYDGDYTKSPIEIAEYWIYTYAASTDGRANWLQKFKGGTIAQTDGFLLKGPGSLNQNTKGQNYTFVGTPKDGVLTTTISAGESYLLGNPYASAISAKKFIEDNLDTTNGSLYFWEHTGEKAATNGSEGHNFGGYIGGYGVRNLSGGVAATSVTINNDSNNGTPTLGDGSYTEPKAFIAIGQGFFIEGDDAASTGTDNIQFNNSQREYIQEGNDSYFFKNENKKATSYTNTLPIIKLGMSYTNDEDLNLHRQLAISFKDNNSFDFDKGYDTEIYDVGATDIYWKFPNNDEKYVITGVQSISEELEVPLELVTSKNGNVTIGIDEWNAIDRDVYLTDKLTNTSYSLNSKTIDLTLAKGTYTDRFVLAFSKATTLSIKDTILENNVSIYLDNNAKEIVIKNNSNLEFKKVALFNLLGQKITEWNTIETTKPENRLKINTLSQAIYIVNIDTKNGRITKKIAVE